MICLTAAQETRSEQNNSDLDRCLAELADKNIETLTELYRLTSTSIYGLALSILKNTHDAEDVLHDCYVNIYHAASDYRPAGKPMAWILTIARNLCLRKLREQKRLSDIPQEDWEAYFESKPEMSADDRILLRDCMDLLNDEERQIIVLHAVSGFKHREIADLMEIPLSTALSKYHRALKKLRNHVRGERN